MYRFRCGDRCAKGEVLRNANVPERPSEQQLSPAVVGEIARPFTVHIECQQAAPSPRAKDGTKNTAQALTWTNAHCPTDDVQQR
jgi:hypothetical protein